MARFFQTLHHQSFRQSRCELLRLLALQLCVKLGFTFGTKCRELLYGPFPIFSVQEHAAYITTRALPLRSRFRATSQRVDFATAELALRCQAQSLI